MSAIMIIHTTSVRISSSPNCARFNLTKLLIAYQFTQSLAVVIRKLNAHISYNN